MKRTLTPLLILLVILQSASSFAQSWQWGKRGGGNTNGLNSTPEDNVMDMATDRNGNVYVLSVIETSGSEDINGLQYTGFGNKDILLSSFSCNGAFRWKKAIGSQSDDPMNGFPYSLRVDTVGHVYVSGNVYANVSGSAKFDSDTTLPVGYPKNMFIAQYDTSGNYQWLRMPQPDTMLRTNRSKYRAVDFDVDNAGNVYWLCVMSPCLLGGTSQVISALGPYILRYDGQGNFLGVVALQMQAGAFYHGSDFKCRMERDKSNGRFYLAGQYDGGTLSMGGQSITKYAYIGAFDNSGNFLWKRENTIGGGFTSRIGIDVQGALYLTGISVNTDNFNGSTITNPFGMYGCPFVVKMDANGNNVWLKNFNTNGASFSAGLALRGNNEVAINGSYPGKLVLPGVDSLNHIINQSYDVYLARFNAQSGAMIALDSIGSPFGYRDMASCLTSDAKGNLYVGGLFSAQITVNTNVLNSSGGDTDFFIAKYGSANCTCTAPVSSYNFNAPANSAIAAFTYNGTSPYDSLRWDFGDGGTSTSATPTHTYASTGTYNVCVTVYNPCGSDTKCQTVSVTVGIDEVQVLGEISIYPNPVSNKLTINGAAGATAELYNVMGSKVYSGKLSADNAEISTAPLPAGSYILQLTTTDGHRKTIKLAKE
ncbi:PKD domain-containing protein [Polluticoccus soli]|uniref:PKD domain-containing protein n=1 Tax=Polluticoccus soli TaxID=3034150 RepID=UPI0023E304BD|nr:PKD domain-containing protein [Flavipsychrobacter sp. JY13-12]